MFRKILLSTSTLALVAAPVAAQTVERQASPAAGKETLAGVGTMGLLIAALLAAGLIIIVADNSKNHHHAASP